MHGAANLHHRTGIAHNVPAAGNKIHGHTDAVGAFHQLVAVVGSVFRRPGLDAPMLIRPGVDGRQRVLETHAVLVQGGLGAGTGGNGEGGIHVLNAGAVVTDRDIHIGVLVRQRDFDAPPDIVGAEVGDGVVGQLAKGLTEVLEVAGNAFEKLLAVGDVAALTSDDFCHVDDLPKYFLKIKCTMQVIALHRAGGSYNIPLAPPAEKGYTAPVGAGNPVV